MTYAYQTENSQSGLFFTLAGKYKNDCFMRAKLKNGEPCHEWIDISWSQAAKEARHLGSGLIGLGIEKTDCVGIFAHSRPRWIITDQAIQGTGAIGVPIYPTSTDSQLTYILNDCSAKAVIAGDNKLLEQVMRIRKDVPTLKFAGCMSPVDGSSDDTVFDYDALMKKGEDSPHHQQEFETRRKALTLEDHATIIYTSGTTGHPKGVILTQANLKAQTDVLLSTPVMEKILEREIRITSLCFLPLCHVMGRSSDYHLQMAIGTTIYFAENVQKIQENLKEVRPNSLVSIPRLYEKIYESVHLYAEKLTGVKKIVFDWAMKAGNTAADYMIEGKPLPLPKSIQFALANILVYSTIRKVIGFDRLIVAASGGGALPKDIAKFFRSMNITITEGYGLTETTSAVTWNGPRFLEPLPDKWIYRKALDWLVDTMVIMQSTGKSPFSSLKGFMKIIVVSKLIVPKFIIKPGFVGTPVKGTEIKIAEDGEILVKGPQVFGRNKGYFKKTDKTDEAFTEDGYFKTGDIGELDKDGFLKITDRKKELIVTSGGKNIAPHPIEIALAMDMYIDQVCVIGDAKKFISALIVPQFELLEKMAGENNISFGTREDLIQSPAIKTFYDEKIAKINESLARYEQIKKYILLPHPFSEETGELTPTQKMKRRVINEKYKGDIDALYA
ncbi:MAG: long-chain fatty acid--CoA ligase [Proteobacteria bacterium]|nr:long-chain fatty acid--CoA ligase [Pseudomonadota bacterium]